MTDNKSSDILSKILFIVYLIALFWIVVLKFNIPLSHTRGVNLIPFKESLFPDGKHNSLEVIMNVVVFIPLGIYAGILFKSWNIAKKLLMFFLISFMCEVSELIMAIGTFDVTDLITNTFGGLIGLIIFLGIEKAFNNSTKAQKFLNIVAITGTILMFLSIFLLKISHLWLFRMES
jgi:glycopeptide antibiotics resistance protein